MGINAIQIPLQNKEKNKQGISQEIIYPKNTPVALTQGGIFPDIPAKAGMTGFLPESAQKI